MQVIFCSILIFFFHSSVIFQVNAENAVENGEDNAQFHDKMSHQRGWAISDAIQALYSDWEFVLNSSCKLNCIRLSTCIYHDKNSLIFLPSRKKTIQSNFRLLMLNSIIFQGVLVIIFTLCFMSCNSESTLSSTRTAIVNYWTTISLKHARKKYNIIAFLSKKIFFTTLCSLLQLTSLKSRHSFHSNGKFGKPKTSPLSILKWNPPISLIGTVFEWT